MSARYASALAGCSVAVRVACEYETVALTSALAASRSWTVVVVTVAGVMLSLNVTVTGAVTAVPVAPDAGVTLLTCGAVTSGATEVANTTSTQ